MITQDSGVVQSLLRGHLAVLDFRSCEITNGGYHTVPSGSNRLQNLEEHEIQSHTPARMSVTFLFVCPPVNLPHRFLPFSTPIHPRLPDSHHTAPSTSMIPTPPSTHPPLPPVFSEKPRPTLPARYVRHALTCMPCTTRSLFCTTWVAEFPGEPRQKPGMSRCHP